MPKIRTVDVKNAKFLLTNDNCSYLMSMRYRCSDTQCGSTYDSHDSEIIEQFSLELHMGFPAVLSHRVFQRQ